MQAAPPPEGGDTLVARVPTRAAGVLLLGEMSHSGFRDPPCLARRGDGQMVQLTPLLYATLEAIDGERDLRAIADAIHARTGRRLDGEDVAYLLDEKLRPLGLTCGADGAEPDVAKASPLLALRWRLVVSRPEVTGRIARTFAWLFQPAVVVAVLAAFAVGVGWALAAHGVGGGLRSMLYDPKQMLLVFGLAALSAGFHELGHAAACAYGGATPGAMGVGLYLVWPAFYTDVTDSYRLDRRGRLRTDLGGLYFNAIFTVGAIAVAVTTGAESLLVLVPLQLLQMAHQMLPILRLDGYHVLADLTGVPDLYARIRPTLRSALPWAERDERADALRPRVRFAVTAWVVLIVPLLVLTLGSVALAMPRVLATAADSVALHWRALQGSWARGDAPATLAGLLSVAAVVLPVAGSLLIAQRIGGRAWRFLWDRFDGAAGRSLLVSTATVVGLALATAWWPSGDYRPLAPGERLRMQELPLVRAVQQGEVEPLLHGAPPRSAAASPGRTAAGTAATPAAAPSEGAAPAGDQGDVVGLVREGDETLALAATTADGSSIFRLAFTVAHIAGGTIDQTNEAVAIASCRDCSAVALAFQVLIVFGEVDDVVPENRAVALNVGCESCFTFASATQIILGFATPVELTEEGRRRLDELHARLLALEGRALTAEELAAVVVEATEEIVEILSEELVPVPPPDPDGEGDGAAPQHGELTSTTTSRTSSTSTSTTTSTSSTSTTSTTTSTTTTVSSSTGGDGV